MRVGGVAGELAGKGLDTSVSKRWLPSQPKMSKNCAIAGSWTLWAPLNPPPGFSPNNVFGPVPASVDRISRGISRRISRRISRDS